MNNNQSDAKLAEECFIEEENQEFRLKLQKKDKTGISALLRQKSAERYHFNDDVLTEVKNVVTILDNKLVEIANDYLIYRNEYEFLYDLVGLSKSISNLPDEAKYLVKQIGNSNDLFHNKIIAQLLEGYQIRGFTISAVPVNCIGGKKHDFNVQDIRCEVKTIRDVGAIEQVQLGFKFTNEYAKKLLARIRDDLFDAKEQVSEHGMIFLAPWSYRINSIFQGHLFRESSIMLPSPDSNKVALELTSEYAFQDNYVSFSMMEAIGKFEEIIVEINRIGLQRIRMMPMRQAMITGYSASLPGTSGGMVFGLR